MPFGMKSSSSSRRKQRKACRRRRRTPPLERIIKTCKNCGALRAVADIDIAHDVRTRDAAKPDAGYFVYVIERIGARVRKYAAEVHERRNLDVEHGCDGIKRKNLAAQFYGAGEGISIVEPAGSK